VLGTRLRTRTRTSESDWGPSAASWDPAAPAAPDCNHSATACIAPHYAISCISISHLPLPSLLRRSQSLLSRVAQSQKEKRTGGGAHTRHSTLQPHDRYAVEAAVGVGRRTQAYIAPYAIAISAHAHWTRRRSRVALAPLPTLTAWTLTSRDTTHSQSASRLLLHIASTTIPSGHAAPADIRRDFSNGHTRITVCLPTLW
jgi:hypothetical protein